MAQTRYSTRSRTSSRSADASGQLRRPALDDRQRPSGGNHPRQRGRLAQKCSMIGFGPLLPGSPMRIYMSANFPGLSGTEEPRAGEISGS
jgi:hypothetical protein